MNCVNFAKAEAFYKDMALDLCENFSAMDTLFRYGKDFLTEMRNETEDYWGTCEAEEELMEDSIISFLKEKYDVEIFMGCYRIVFSSANHDYVLKVSYDDSYDNDCNVIEENFFTLAEEYEVDQYFASVVNIGTIHEFYTDLFLAEKCKANNEKIYSYEDYGNSNKKLKDITAKYSGKHDPYCLICCCGIGVLYAFIESYFMEDADNFIKFLNFLEKTKISDIHSDNVGFDKNGKIKIIDYSLYGGNH